MGTIFSLGCCAASCGCSILSNLISLCCCCTGSGSSPSVSVGRKRSVALLLFAILFSIILEHFVAPKYQFSSLNYAWKCDEYPEEFQPDCRGVSSVLRVSFACFIFFLVALLSAAVKPSFNSRFWGAKIAFFLILLCTSMFLPASLFDQSGYLQVARVAATIFIVLQQVILIDLAYSWNDQWVFNADESDKEAPGSGDNWLRALVGVSLVIYVGSYTALGYLFSYFGTCTDSNGIIWTTLVLTLVATILQLTGDEGSLLTSAIMTGYSVYLAYAAVSSNPSEECNPLLGDSNILGVVVGLLFVSASMAWTCFSASSSITEMMTSERHQKEQSNQQSLIPVYEDNSKVGTSGVTGVLAGKEDSDKEVAASETTDDHPALANGQPWKLNLCLLLISCWYACVLTSWGQVTNGTDAANPEVGSVTMWMNAAGGWIAIFLYGWTLVAPRVCTDRDFS